MQHNTAVRFNGRCDCPCHHSTTAKCICGLSTGILRGNTTRLKSGKLSSRVKPFATWQPVNKIAVKQHKTHANFGGS